MEFGPTAKSQLKSAEITAKIIRADGTEVELGTVDYWHKNPFKTWAFQLKRWFKKVTTKK